MFRKSLSLQCNVSGLFTKLDNYISSAVLLKLYLFSSCHNTVGGYICSCENGLVGDPFHGTCHKPGDCTDDVDCPATATCIENTCRDPCIISPSLCGLNANCKIVDHKPICSCPLRTTGDPNVCISFYIKPIFLLKTNPHIF